MFRFAQFLGSEGISVSLSSVDYDPYMQYNYLFKLDEEYVDDEISKKLDPEIQRLEKLIQDQQLLIDNLISEVESLKENS